MHSFKPKLTLLLAIFLCVGCDTTPNDAVSLHTQTPGYVGLQLENIPTNAATKMRLGNDRRVWIRGVSPRSPAALAGVQIADVIVSLNGEDVASFFAAMNILDSVGLGGQVSVVVDREGVRHQFEMVKAAIPRDDVMASELREMADNAVAWAQIKLGYYYFDGVGVHVDRDEAQRLFRAAAELGDPEGMYVLGQSYLEIPAEIKSAAEKEAFQWISKAADAGYAAAQLHKGLMLFRGQGTSINAQAAWPQLCRAAEQSHPVAMRIVGEAYCNPKPQIGEFDRQKGMALLNAAIEAGDPVAGLSLLIAKFDAGDEETRHFAAQFATNHDPFAMFLDARQFLIDVASLPSSELPDYAGALNVIQQAADAGLPQACFLLGEIYSGQLPLPNFNTDHQTARTWYLLAANAGHLTAIERVRNFSAPALPMPQGPFQPGYLQPPAPREMFPKPDGRMCKAPIRQQHETLLQMELT